MHKKLVVFTFLYMYHFRAESGFALNDVIGFLCTSLIDTLLYVCVCVPLTHIGRFKSMKPPFGHN